MSVKNRIWMLPLLVYPAPVPRPGDAWLTVLDVGQGLAVLVRDGGHSVLVDTGPPDGAALRRSALARAAALGTVRSIRPAPEPPAPIHAVISLR